MAGFRRMIDMARSPEEVKKDLAPLAMPSPESAPSYPYGLCISLTEDELEKLGIDGDCEIGDMIHLFAMAEVTSCSEHKTKAADGSEKTCCRIELQITHLGLEDEDREEEPDGKARKRYGDDDDEEEEGDGEALGSRSYRSK